MVLCPYCSNGAKLVTGATVYPNSRRPGVAESFFWLCEPCEAWVGCRRYTKIPLGTLAKPNLRTLRMEAHAAFDPIWKEHIWLHGIAKGNARTWAYNWLSTQLGRPDTHISQADEDTCIEIIRICNGARSSGHFIDPELKPLNV